MCKYLDAAFPALMTNTNARKILELDPLVTGASEALEALLVSDQPFAQRVLACASMPGLGRRSGIELGDLVPLHGFRFVQQVVAGLLLDDAGVDATNFAILSGIAAQVVAMRVPVQRGEEAFFCAWLGATPAWRQAPSSWGVSAELVSALDRHQLMPESAQLVATRPDVIAQCVRLGGLLASFASPYPESGVMEAVQRAARLGIHPRDLDGICGDIARNAADWSNCLKRPIKADLRLDLNLPAHATAMRVASELAEVYRHLLQTAAVDAETGLPNARYFHTRLESEWAAARRRSGELSVVCVLCRSTMAQPAQLLRETARMQDVVCRSGDGEFMIICTDTHAEYAARAAERLSEEMKRSGVTAFFGTATLDSMISSVDDLVERARSAARAARAETGTPS